MQAWKIIYSNAKDPGMRYTAGIVSNSREDAVNTISRTVKFPFNVERTEFLGVIHALSEEAEQKIAIYYNNMHKNGANVEISIDANSKTPATGVQEETLDDKISDNNSTSIEIECQYCGSVHRGEEALLEHEQNCDKNTNKQITVEDTSKKDTFICEKCNKDFKTAAALSSHSKACNKAKK